MSRSVGALFLAGFMMLASSAYAQQADSVDVTLDRCVEIMLKNSRSLHASHMKIEAAEARAGETKSATLPSVKLGATYTRLSEVPAFALGAPLFVSPMVIFPAILDNYNLRLSIQQPLFTGSRLSGNAGIADLLAGSSREEFERDRSDLIFAAKSAYWTLYKSREVLKVVEENVRQIQTHLGDITNLLNQGMATKNELLRVEVQLSEAQLRRINAENNVLMAQYNLNTVLGLPIRTHTGLTTDLRHESISVSPADTLVQRAITSRSDVKALELKVKAAEEGVTVARSGWYPQIFLSGNFYYSRPNQRFIPARDEFKETWDVGVSLSWDVWNWGATLHQTEYAGAQHAQAVDALAQRRDGITLEVTQAYLALEEARQRIEVAEKGVAQGEENYRMTSQKYKAGLVLSADLIDAEAALLSTKWSLIQALADYNIAQAGLEKATGDAGRKD